MKYFDRKSPLFICSFMVLSSLLLAPLSNAQKVDDKSSRPEFYDLKAKEILEIETSSLESIKDDGLKAILALVIELHQADRFEEEEKALYQALDYINRNPVSVDDAYSVFHVILEFHEIYAQYDKQAALFEQFVVPRIYFLNAGTHDQQYSFEMLTYTVIDNWIKKKNYNLIEPFILGIDQHIQTIKPDIKSLVNDDSKREWWLKDGITNQLYALAIRQTCFQDSEIGIAMLQRYLMWAKQKGYREDDYTQIKAIRDVADALYEHKKYEQAEYWLNQIKNIQREYWTSDNIKHLESALDDAIMERFALVYQALGKRNEAEKIWLDFLTKAQSVKLKSEKLKFNKKTTIVVDNRWNINYGLLKSLHNLEVFYTQQNEPTQAAKMNLQYQKIRKTNKIHFDYNDNSPCGNVGYCLIIENSGT